MADKVITFGAAQSFGAVSGFNEQTSSVAVSKSRASAHNAVGVEVVSSLYDERTDVSTPYKVSSAATTAILPASIGALLNALIVTDIKVNTAAGDYAGVTIGGHNHAANAHAASPALTSWVHGIALTSGFGATDFLGGTAGDNASVKSSSCTIKCDHVDEIGATGDHLVGNNFNPMVEAEVVWVGVPTTAVGAGWDSVSVVTGTDAQGLLTTTARGVKALS